LVDQDPENNLGDDRAFMLVSLSFLFVLVREHPKGIEN